MKNTRKAITYYILSLGLILILAPLYLTLVSSFKETKQITGDFLGVPEPFVWDNHLTVFKEGLGIQLLNSAMITFVHSVNFADGLNDSICFSSPHE